MDLRSADAYVVAAEAGGLADFVLEATSLTLTVVTEEVRSVDNPLGGGPITSRGTPVTEVHAFTHARMTLGPAAGAPDLLFTMTDAVASGTVQGLPLAFSPVREPPQLCTGADPACRFDYAFPVAMEFGGPSSRSPLALVGVGDIQGRAIRGVAFDVRDATGTFNVRAEETSTTPAVGSPARIGERTYVYVEAQGATLTVVPVAEGLVIGLTQPTARIDGTLRAPRAFGTIDAGDRIVSVSDEEVLLTGDILLTLRPGPAPGDLVATSNGNGQAGTATIGGSASALSVAGVAYGVPPWRDSERVVAAAGIAIVLFALFEKARAAGLIALAPFYTRIRQRDMLKNETRSQIFDLVRAQPGMHFRGLLRETGLAPGTLQHHLQTLERQGFVRSMTGGSRRLYFPTGMRIEEPIESHEALSKPTAVQVARGLMETPGTTQAALTESLGMNQTTVSYNLRKLVEAGLVVAETGRPRRYTPTTTLERLLPAS